MTPAEKINEIEESISNLRLPAFSESDIFLPQYDIEPRRRDIPLSQKDIDFLMSASGNINWLISRVKKLEAALGRIDLLHKKSSNPYKEAHAENCAGCIARKALEGE